MKKRGARASDLNCFLSLPNRKRSLSTVVASLLMILLVVVAVGVVSKFLIPMIKKDLSSAGSCLDAIGNVQFNNQYTCYDKNNNKVRASIEVKRVQVSGFVVNIFGEGSAKSYVIKEGIESDILMYNDDTPFIIKIPGENEARTYLIPIDIANPGTITVSPIVGGETCEEADNLILNKCQ